MSKIKLTGSNSGYVEISSAADAGNLTLSLPTSGTALLSNGNNVYTGITTFTNDFKLEGGSYDVLWDASDNQLEFDDNAKVSFGGGLDMQLHSDGTNGVLRQNNNSGGLYIQADNFVQIGKVNAGSPIYGKFIKDGAVELYFNGNKKFETTNTGAVVTGICTATVLQVERGSDSNNAIEINTTSTSNACRIKFNESGSNKAQIAYSHDNDRLELVASSGNSIAFYGGGNLVSQIDTSGHFIPQTNNVYDLGSTTKGWRNVYMNDLNLSNMNGDTNDVDGTQGSWTIQEGKDDLYIINRLNGKKFKIKMEEIS